MEYEGKIYGKIGGKYVELKETRSYRTAIKLLKELAGAVLYRDKDGKYYHNTNTFYNMVAKKINKEFKL